MLGPSDVKIKGSTVQASPSVRKETWVTLFYIYIYIHTHTHIHILYFLSIVSQVHISTSHKDGDRQLHAVCCTYPLHCLRTFTLRQFTQLLLLQYFPFFPQIFVSISSFCYPRPRIQAILRISVPTSQETCNFSTKTLNRHLLLIWYKTQNAEFLNEVARIVTSVLYAEWTQFTSSGEVRAVLQQTNSADVDCSELQVTHTIPASRVAQQQREQPDRPYRPSVLLITGFKLVWMMAALLQRDCHYSYCRGTATTVTADGLPLQLLQRDSHFFIFLSMTKVRSRWEFAAVCQLTFAVR